MPEGTGEIPRQEITDPLDAGTKTEKRKRFTKLGWPRGRHQPPRGQQVPAVSDKPEASEQPSDLERHKRRVASEVLTFLNQIDAVVAEDIGFEGNIREELFRRRPLRTHEQINTEGMDPNLRPYLIPGEFFYRDNDTAGKLRASYAIDYHAGDFTPRIEVRRPDSLVKLVVFTGPSRDEYDTVQIEKTFSDQSTRTVTTFPSSSEVLRIDDHGIHTVYDTIDSDGNVALKDGLPVRWGRYLGNYSAKDHTIVPQGNYPFPPVAMENDVLIFKDEYERQVTIRTKTNLYDEIRAMTSDPPSLSQK